jgi:hypothetical protein
MTTPLNTEKQAEEECLTIISRVPNAPLFEFHRQRLAKQGYQIKTQILTHRFELIDENGQKTKLLDGEKFYAATYSKTVDCSKA